MRLKKLHTESLSTGAVANWSRTSFFGRDKFAAKKKQRPLLSKLGRQFQSGGPQPPFEVKPRQKVKNSRARVNP